MTARIVHFGIDDFDRLRNLRDAGYSVDSSNSLTELRILLGSNKDIDAFALTESNRTASSDVVSLIRASSDAPLILFRGWTSSAVESEFNLVVPVLTPPDIWLREVAALTEYGRVRRAKSPLLRHESRQLRKEGGPAVEEPPEEEEVKRPAQKRSGISSVPSNSFLLFEPPPVLPQNLRRGKFLSSLGEKALLDFQAHASFSSCGPGTVFFVEGQPPHEVFVLLEGQVRLFMNSNEGKRLTVHIAGPGEILGLASAFTAAPHRTTAETLYPSKVASSGCAEFMQFLLFHPDASLAAARELSEYCDRSYTRLRTIGVTPSNRSKLARLLLEWSEQGQQTERGTQIHLALKHGEIAECIGTCRESVTRILRDLQRWNVIELRGSLLTITDQSALEHCAELK
jgi:CRP/FNR family transcriptional regulator, cyclic AMP receptor protein